MELIELEEIDMKFTRFYCKYLKNRRKTIKFDKKQNKEWKRYVEKEEE